MIKQTLVVIAVVAVAVVGNVGAVSAHHRENHDGNSDDNVTICHRTNSVNNPYNQITVDEAAINDGNPNDHAGHTGPVPTSEAEAQAMKDAKTDWGDIIPPVGDFPGLNWTAEGRAIYDNGCNFVAPGRGGGDPTVNATPASTTTPVVVAALPSTSGENAVATIATVSLAAVVIAALSFAVKAAYVKFF